ncbi:MAG: hypothetical protein DRO73_05940 [Candidatus Thorarchaeota archaeon]|nr:MAG: hypothetical protein DRO73_05940 [Candidatus Thorarchaeota archaeon]
MERQMDADIESQLTRLLLFVLLILLYVEISALLPRLAPIELRGAVATLAFFLVMGLMYATVSAFLRWEGRGSISNLGLKIDDTFAIHLFFGAIAGGAAAGLVVLIALFFGGQLRPASEITVDLLVSEAIITIPVALIEELCYRGYMLTRMVRLWGRATGILVSSIVFALFHFSWWTPLGTVPPLLIVMFTANIALGGAVLSIGYYLSGERLWVPIGFHFGWNVVAYVMFPVYPRTPVMLPEVFQIEWGVTTVAGFLFGLSLLHLLLSRQRMNMTRNRGRGR